MLQKMRIYPTKKIEKLFLLIFLSLLIGYMLSPKIIFQKTIYLEDDIIYQDIIAEKDILLVDKGATNLKKEQQLSELGMIFDYDPTVLTKITEKIETAFSEIKQTNVQLELERKQQRFKYEKTGEEYFLLHRKHAELKKESALLRINETFILKRLSEYKDKTNLTPQELQIKQKLDFNLQTIQGLLEENQNKIDLNLQEQKKFTGILEEQEKEKTFFQKEFEEKKESAVRLFLETLNITTNAEEKKLLLEPFYQGNTKFLLQKLMQDFLVQKILLSKTSLQNDLKGIPEQRNLATGEVVKLKGLNGILDISEVQILLREKIKQLPFTQDKQTQQTILQVLGEKLIQPTLTENKLELEKRKKEIQEKLSPVYINLKKGEMIARRGDKASKAQVALLNVYQDAISNIGKIPQIIGIILMVGFLFFLSYVSLVKRKNIISISYKQLCMVGFIIFLTIVFTKIGVLLTESLETNYANISSRLYYYAFPVTLSSMLIGILINFEIAFISGVLTSIFVAILMQNNLYYFFFALSGNFIASLPISHLLSRFDFLKHGIKVSFVNMLAVILTYLIQSNQIDINVSYGLMTAFLGGLIAAILTTFLLPLFESIFDITTDLKLLELSNMNHPALKELMLCAPGTYHHSIMVGNLAEAGALAIGANPLLCRVSAYYHDIGKGKNAKYFVENSITNKSSYHDELNNPHKSAEIIIEHVSEGERIAKKYRLGSAIINILKEHHGTTLVQYFYHKAKENLKEGETIDKSQFQYLGPKPQNLESAIVMLADSCEAATRSLDDPTPEKIESMVKQVGEFILNEHQLDESSITLKQFRTIMNTYIEVLCTVYHQRIKYPGQAN